METCKQSKHKHEEIRAFFHILNRGWEQGLGWTQNLGLSWVAHFNMSELLCQSSAFQSVPTMQIIIQLVSCYFGQLIKAISRTFDLVLSGLIAISFISMISHDSLVCSVQPRWVHSLLGDVEYLSSHARRFLAAPIRSTTEVRKSFGRRRETRPS